MICKNCGKENSEEALFCLNCGQKLCNSCPNCGFVNDIKSKFCIKCGVNLKSNLNSDEKSKETSTKLKPKKQGVINLIRKIISIVSFSVCLILMGLTIGASFTDILTAPHVSELFDGTVASNGSLNLFSIIDNISAFKIDEKMFHYEYTVIGDLSMQIVLLVCVISIMASSAICFIIAIGKIISHRHEFVSLERLTTVMFGFTLASTLVASMMCQNFEGKFSSMIFSYQIRLGSFIKICLILDFCSLVAIYAARCVLDIIEKHNFKMIASYVLNISFMVLFFIGSLNITSSVLTLKDDTFFEASSEYSIGSILSLLCAAAYQYCNNTSRTYLSDKAQSLMNNTMIGYVVVFFVAIILAVFFAVVLYRMLNHKNSILNIVFSSFAMILSIAITIIFSQTIKDTAVTINSSFSAFDGGLISYPNYSLGASLIAPIILFALALLISIGNTIYNKIIAKKNKI